MPRAPKACSFPECDERVTARSYCDEHAATLGKFRDLRRGTPQQRGYDHAHRKQRARWAPLVARGTVDCWRCGQPIQPDEAWDLGHDDHDRTITRGPEHARQCNRSSAGRWKPETF